MNEHFVSIFKQPEAPTARGKYLSRVFGIFSEEIVRIWASDPRAPYEDLGRPTLRLLGEKVGSTLDFALRSRRTGKTYVAELKCEIEYQDYRYLVLTDPGQLKHHSKAAFTSLLDAAVRRSDQRAYVGRAEIQIDGAILIWGATTSDGRAAVVSAKRFFDVLTLAEIISDYVAGTQSRIGRYSVFVVLGQMSSTTPLLRTQTPNSNVEAAEHVAATPTSAHDTEPAGYLYGPARAATDRAIKGVRDRLSKTLRSFC